MHWVVNRPNNMETICSQPKLDACTGWTIGTVARKQCGIKTKSEFLQKKRLVRLSDSRMLFLKVPHVKVMRCAEEPKIQLDLKMKEQGPAFCF